MLRDFKFLRRNSGKSSNTEEIENVPVNPKDSMVTQTGADSMRPPLNTIQEPILNSKGVVEQGVGVRSTSKVDKTPTKVKGRSSETGMPLRTPEKPGVFAKNRFGWAQKNESTSSAADEGRADLTHYTSRGAGNYGGMGQMTPQSTRTMGRATSGYSDCNSTQSTPTKSVSKPPNPGLCLTGGARPPANGGARMANFAALAKGIPISCSSSTVVNTVEVPHFDLKEDPSFWMDHNVQVLIRIRPLNSKEKSMHAYNRCLKQESAQCITWIGQPETRFTFDHVACETIDQETLFRMAGLPMVENCLSGYNSCIFAYGQTGSGKTYTMLGEIEELEVRPSQNRGMTPRIFEFLFERIRAEEESRRDERLKYYCKCSFLEIYNEQITDLLDPSSSNLLLREDIKKGVYVENLSEFEVQGVGDILKLLSQGSTNRKVAATNMNRESSRSHSVFTCVLERRWEKDSSSNLRFARLNLVDLAGSERQKTSGAEGDRLKEAASINKSLSTLGHVIMILVDVAHGKPKHVPYRDSRLTFLLQDSLGGNSKTMMIANVSPSICCAAETLNTLKFAQRAKLIQNNAVVNEDYSGDVIVLQHQIRILKEELSALKRQNVSRSLSFGSTVVEGITKVHENACDEKAIEIDQQSQRSDSFLGSESKGTLRMSSKQLKSLETTLAGALRREQMAETSIKQLEAEIEQLNRLVRQREEDSRCTKMMLKFREDKIQRMESLLNGSIPPDSYLLEENRALSEEIQMLQAKVDRNPEVTRFALENIRLLEQLRRFQDFYQEGERELLLDEVSELRDQLVLSLDGNPKQHNHPKITVPSQEAIHASKQNELLHLEMKRTMSELEECRSNLKSCLESNAKLSREIDDLRASLINLKSATCDYDRNFEVVKESILEAPLSADHQSFEEVEKQEESKHEILLIHSEEVINLQLELDLLKIIIKEERSSREEIEQRTLCLNQYLELANGKISVMIKEFEGVKEEFKEARSVIEALESQQILSINEIEDLRNSNSHYLELLDEQELEISTLKKQISIQELQDLSSFKQPEIEDSPLQAKLKKMHNSLEKAKRLNMRYQSDREFQVSNEEEMNEVRSQVEAETAEVIVCLQEELSILQQQVQDSNLKERQTEERLVLLQTELKELQEELYWVDHDKKKLSEMVKEKDEELSKSSEAWELLTSEIEIVLASGHEALSDASNQLDEISSSFPQKRAWISEKVGRMTKLISEKEFLIEELNQYLEDANDRISDMECMLRSLKGAALVITEAHQQECCEKDKEIVHLTMQLSAKISTIEKLENRIEMWEEQMRKTSVCATVAFLIVNRLSDINSENLSVLKQKDIQLSESMQKNLQRDDFLHNQAAAIDEAEKQIHALKMELQMSEETCGKLKLQVSEEQRRVCAMEEKLEEIEENDILKTREKLTELKSGVLTLSSCMNDYVEQIGSSENDGTPGGLASLSVNSKCRGRTGAEINQGINDDIDSCTVKDLEIESLDCSFEGQNNVNNFSSNQKKSAFEKTSKDVSQRDATKKRDATIIHLRKEMESALESLKGVQAEMAKLRNEKEEVSMSAKRSQESIDYLVTQVLILQANMSNFDEQLIKKMKSLDHNLCKVEDTVQNVRTCWYQKKELFELELGEIKVVAAQKTEEASRILTQFEEAQDTMKDADIMINGLIIANETLKLEIEGLKKMEVSLVNEKNALINDVQSLQSANDLKDQQYENLENQFALDMVGMERLVLELESIVAQVQTTFKEDFMSVDSAFLCIKSQLQDSKALIRSWLEDIWSEIIVKDCAVSVPHLCHMGILLETVTGLNAENGLLHHGLCESTSVISELKEHNFKSRRELEMCRILKGKLLTDIRNGFNRIARKENEAGELSIKLTTFEKKILDLQLQEELMLQRANHMGSELSILVKELDTSNINILAPLLDQEKFLKDKLEALKSQEETFEINMSAKDFEHLFLASELEQMAIQKSDMEDRQISYCAVLENFKEKIIFLTVDAELKTWMLMEKEVEVALVRKEVEETQKERQDLLSRLHQSNSRITYMDKVNNVLEQDIQLLKDVQCSNDCLKSELGEVMEAKVKLSSQLKKFEDDYEGLSKEMMSKEMAVEISSGRISLLDHQNQMLQKDICLLEASSCELKAELEMRDKELSKTSNLEEENELMKSELQKLKGDYCIVVQDLEDKTSELGSSLSRISVFDIENNRLQGQISSLQTCTGSLQTRLDLLNAELNQLHLSHSVITNELRSERQNLQIYVDRVNTLKEENVFLRSELASHQKNKYEFLTALSLNMVESVESLEIADMVGSRIINVLNERGLELEKMLEEVCENMERTSKFMEEFESLENFAKELVSENLSLQTQLSRKDDVLNGLLFDLSLLQESASNNKDQKDEIEELVTSLEALEDELVARSCELDEAASKGLIFEAKLQEKIAIISMLEVDISKECDSAKSLSSRNVELMANIEDALESKRSIEEKLLERMKINESLELELSEMGTALDQMNSSIRSLRSTLNEITSERDDLQNEVLILKEKLELAQTLAEENEAIAMEAQQIAETRKLYAEDKEEEVRLLERSVEELECTVNVLENKVDIVKGEAERQRLQREDLESELDAIKQQMQSVKSSDADMKRYLDERQKELQEALQRIEILEREITVRDAEIAQCKVHISELNLHAEAQACEYKQKFKALETMAEQVKPEGPSTHPMNSSPNKFGKSGSKSRGSGSPFKCIGLGLVQQVKSEREEELTAGRLRIEELEALAASRQKEIFMLNARLAAAESMTHDVIRDLLGLKLDMTSYASLLDNHQVQRITEKAQLCNVETEVKEKEIILLKQQLNEFIEERKGWLEEIERKQAEMVAAQIALEKLRQRDRLLTTENEMFKMENVNHKKKVMELEAELNKLSGQQNLQQRIHHHAKIKEENHMLKVQNENLGIKLQRTEAVLSRVKEELAHFRTSNGRSPYINFDEEQHLNNKLKETEEERLQLARKLLGLCTSILKATGITTPSTDVSLPVAEEALEQIKNRLTLQERELQDLKFKNKISIERARLSELMPHSSPVSSIAGDNRQTPNRVSQTPFLSALDR